MGSLPWLSVFLGLSSAGILMCASTVAKRDVGLRFYRRCLAISFSLAVVALATSGIVLSEAPGVSGLRVYLLVFVSALLVYLIVVRVRGLLPSRWANAFFAACGIAVCIAGLPSHRLAGAIAFCPTSAAVLGMTAVSLLLGHTYRSKDNLPPGLLVRACKLLMGAFLLRGAVSLISFLPSIGIVSEWVEGEAVLLLLVGVRYVVGIGCAFALAWMALACANIRSSQSATGILYVVLGFAIMGEIIASYIMGEKGIVV